MSLGPLSTILPLMHDDSPPDSVLVRRTGQALQGSGASRAVILQAERLRPHAAGAGALAVEEVTPLSFTPATKFRARPSPTFPARYLLLDVV